MLSILIPTYNYNVQPLVLELEKQAEELEILYEIIIGEDCITSPLSMGLLKLNELKNIQYYINPINFGRAKNRNELVKKAKFELLLFLDADTFPTNAHFIKTYLDFYTKNNTSVLFGGLKYQKEKPKVEKMLRWVYGIRSEAQACEVRKKNPYKIVFTSNLLIKKKLLEEFPFDNTITKYGHEDTILFKSLKDFQISLKHIENPVYHLGLEETKIYIHKIEDSLTNLKTLMEHNRLEEKDIKIIEKYNKLKKYHLLKFFVLFYKTSRFLLLKNLMSSNPNLFLFDLYRLGYFCTLK